MPRPFSLARLGSSLVLLTLLGALAHPLFGAQGDSLAELRVDNAAAPLGLDDPKPMFSWQMRSGRPGARQQGYAIEVASSTALLEQGRADLWRSGRVASADSLEVAYAGKPLAARTRYFWQVRTWDEQGQPVHPHGSSWETGLMEPANWQAQWLARDTQMERDNRAANPLWITAPASAREAAPGERKEQFRLRFSLAEKPAEATLLLTARPNPAAWVNGRELPELHPMNAPGTDYPWGTFTQVDVTADLVRGQNVIAAEARAGTPAEPLALLSLLVVRSPDGTVKRYISDPNWRVATTAPAGWTNVRFDDSSWQTPVVAGRLGDKDYAYPWPPQPAAEFRRHFTPRAPVTSARLYATALGTYLPYLNGERVGRQILAPGWTDYLSEVPYQTYDVTAQIRGGVNTLAMRLGDGWYASGLVNLQRRFNFGAPPPRLKAQLELRYSDGTSETIATDATWQMHGSPILKSDLYNGEIYDARLADAAWNRSGGGEVGWEPATRVEGPGPAVKLVAQAWPPIEQELELHPRSIVKTAGGDYLVDLGQDMVGVERLRVRGPAGTTVRLQFGEVLSPDGSFYRANMRSAAEEDDYTLSGRGDEVFEPSFTYHGFRYVLVSGYPHELRAEDLTGVVFHTAAPQSIVFHSSNTLVDKLVSNIEWGQRGNFMSVPTDCPQRDERLGWMGDAQVFWRTASYDMDLSGFSRKFAADMRIAQTPDGAFTDISPRVLEVAGAGTPGWADAGLVIPWTAYLQYGDKQLLARSWESMQRWMRFLAAHAPDFIVPAKGYGDWLSIDSDTQKDLIGTAFFAYDDALMIEIATALGKPEDAAAYRQQLAQVTHAFQAKFIAADGKIGNGSQTADVLALRMGLVPEPLRAKVADALLADLKRHGDHLTTGFLGTPYLLPVLSDAGHINEAFDLLLQTTYPSWGYMIEHGATTMWERWNGNQKFDDPSMNSFNHYAYGSVGEWLYRYVAGIDTSAAAPAFHTIVLRPHFDRRLGSVDMVYDSAYGPVRSAWRYMANAGGGPESDVHVGDVQVGDVRWTVSVPPNTSAAAYLPKAPRGVSSGSSKSVTDGLCSAVSGGDGVVCRLMPGSYTFTID